MGYELFGRFCVGGPLKPEVAEKLNKDFLHSLSLSDDATPEQIFLTLLDDTPKHKRHEPDRVRYERAFEAFVDGVHAVDMALGGLSPEGIFVPRKNYIFVGVCVETFVAEQKELGRSAHEVERPRWVKWGELGSSSNLGKTFELDRNGEKAWDHARRSYQRAHKDIYKDAIGRLKSLDVAKQHDIDWALCRWLVPKEHPSTHAK